MVDPMRGITEEVLLGILNTLCNSCWNLFGLAVTDANCSFAVSNNN
jgi:hypothetical protein